MGEKEERWYRFDQVEVMVRPFWMKARTSAEARRKVRDGGPVTEGVPDVAPDGATDFRIQGRGRLEPDQELVEYRRAELEGAVQ